MPLTKVSGNEVMIGDLLIECRATESEADREQRESQREGVKQTDREQRVSAMKGRER